MTDELRAALYACRAILIKLQLIDDAPASRLRPGPKPPQYATSRVPEGVRSNGIADHAPSKQFSLWAHYSWRMERARNHEDASELLKLAGCATRDYEIHTHKRPAFHEKHEAAVTELLRDCTGVSATEASWWLGAPVTWVKRQRVINGRDAELGEPIQTNGRSRRIIDLKANGATVRTIAAEVGVSTGYVSNVLNGKTSTA